MQYSIVLFAAAALSASVTHTASSTITETITSCDESVTDCPARPHKNDTHSSTFSDNAAAGAHGQYYAAGAAALAAGALLM